MGRQLGIVTAVALVAAALGWFARGLVDTPPAAGPTTGPETAADRETATAPGSVDDADRVERRRVSAEPVPPAGLSPNTGSPPPQDPDALRREMLERLPELLREAREQMDHRRAQALLTHAVESGREDYVQLVADALLSEDLAYDFSHRDDVFESMLIDYADATLADAAIRRLRVEIENGEHSQTSIGGYARVLGAARTREGRAFLEELLQSENAQLREVGGVGLISSGDPTVLAPIGAQFGLHENEFYRFLDRADADGPQALRNTLLAEQLTDRSRENIAEVLGKRGGPEDLYALEEAWHRGHQRAAMQGYMNLRGPQDETTTLERARERVLATVQDPDADRGARRGAFYVLEYSDVFKTEQAEVVLAALVERTEDQYWRKAAIEALKDVRRHLRVAAARRED